MSRIKLKSIVSEIIKEMVDTHPVHKKINDKLMQIAKRGSEDEKEEKENIKEGDSDIQRIDMSYAYPGQKFYSITVDNKKISDHKEANQIINSLTGLDLPYKADYTDPEVYKIVDALKAKGIQAGSYEQSVD